MNKKYLNVTYCVRVPIVAESLKTFSKLVLGNLNNKFTSKRGYSQGKQFQNTLNHPIYTKGKIILGIKSRTTLILLNIAGKSVTRGCRQLILNFRKYYAY